MQEAQTLRLELTNADTVAESFADLLREDLAAAVADASNTKQEADSLRLELANAGTRTAGTELRAEESWLSSGIGRISGISGASGASVEPAVIGRDVASVAVQAGGLLRTSTRPTLNLFLPIRESV